MNIHAIKAIIGVMVLFYLILASFIYKGFNNTVNRVNDRLYGYSELIESNIK